MSNKKKRIETLEERIETLEEYFKDPELELYDTEFEKWAQHQGAIGAHRSMGGFQKDFYALLDYLKLEVVIMPEHKVVRKLTPKPKEERK